MSSKFTQLDEIEVGLRYIQRLRSLQPSKATMDDLARQETDLRQQKQRLLEDGPTNRIETNPRYDGSLGRRRAGF